MKADSLKRARPMRLAVLGAAIAMVMAACTPPPEEPTDPVDPGDGRISFDSEAVLDLSIDRGTPEEPDVASLPFTGQATGAWLLEDNGLFYVDLDIDDAALEVSAEASPIGVALTVGLEATQTRTGVGFFDPATGEGGFSTGVEVNIATLDAGSGPAPMPQPCIATASFDFTGAIDAGTGLLEVSHTDFDFTPPAATDCGGLGEAIQGMLDGTAVGELSFEVGTP